MPGTLSSAAAHVTVVLHDSGGVERGGADASAAQTFALHIAKLHPLHNAANPLDASGDNSITAVDALDCINHLNAFGPGPASSHLTLNEQYLDINGDGSITAIDPLMVINHLNAFGPTTGSPGGGEGESPVAAPASETNLIGVATATARPPAAADLSSIVALLANDAAQQAMRRRKSY